MTTLVIFAIGAVVLVLIGVGAAMFLNRQGGDVEARLEDFVETDAYLEFADDEADSGFDDKGDMADKADKALEKRQFFANTKKLIAKTDYKLRVSEYMALTIILAVVGAIAGGYFFGGIVFNVIGLFVGSCIPKFMINRAAKKRVQTFNNQLGDMLNLWVNALRSGYSVLQGMETVATEMPAPIAKEFERVVQEVRLGLSVEQALDNMYQRVPSEDLDLVITAVNIQREVGGNLAEVLDSISFTIRERVRIKGEVRVLTSQGRASGWIITFLPVILSLILYAINPEYIGALFFRKGPWVLPGVIPCGWLLTGVTLIMIAAGGAAIQKIVNIEV